jgi:hypothetical protein
LPEKKSTFVTEPSLSLADAETATVAGAVKVAPADGLVIDTDGAMLFGAVPAVVKLHTGPSAVMCAIVFETIFQ